MKNGIDFYGRRLNCYKAALHMHSTRSDGQFSPEEIIRMYGGRGFDVLAFSDHRKTNPVSTYPAGEMTLISGIELHPVGPRGGLWHLLSLGVPEDFTASDTLTAQQTVDAVRAAGGIVFAAHPYWCGFTSAEVMSLKNIAGIEVYNTSTRYIGREFNMQLWDETLTAGRRFSALAVDDLHTPNELFQGWTVICAEDREPATLLKALERGDFYSSQGPEFRRLSWKNGVLEAEFTPAASVIALCTAYFGWIGRDPEKSDPLATSMRWEIPEEILRQINYLRIQIRDEKGRYAWSMPIYLQ